jgi:hypothetical protein
LIQYNDAIECPNPNCNAVFYYWSLWVEMHCPVCRGDFEVDEESDIKRGNRFDFMPKYNIVRWAI